MLSKNAGHTALAAHETDRHCSFLYIRPDCVGRCFSQRNRMHWHQFAIPVLHRSATFNLLLGAATRTGSTPLVRKLLGRQFKPTELRVARHYSTGFAHINALIQLELYVDTSRQFELHQRLDRLIRWINDIH